MRNTSGARQAAFIILTSLLIPFLTACSSDGESSGQAVSQLSAPSTQVTGSSVVPIGPTTYLFADSTGAVSAAGNMITASFADPNEPLFINNLFSDSVANGSCATLGTLAMTIPTYGVVSTSVSASGCTDQAVLTVNLNTSQVFDNQGYNGQGVVPVAFTIDLAPGVGSASTAVATGNLAVDGSSGSYPAPGNFRVATDHSLVVGFNKNMTGATLAANFGSCAATLGSPTILPVSGAYNKVAWPVSNASAVIVSPATTGTCTLDISGIVDANGNPEDPSDPDINMTVTFE